MANGQYQGSGNAVFRRNGDGGFLSALRNTLFGRPLTPEDLEKMLEEPIVPAEMPLGPGSIKSVLQLARGAQGVSRPAIDWVTRLMRGGGSSGTQAVQRVRPRMRAREGVALAGDVAQQTIPKLLAPGKEITTYHGTAHTFAPTQSNPLGEFDLGKMGTGEGAQTYGRGMYLTENREIGDWYRRQFAVSGIRQASMQAAERALDLIPGQTTADHRSAAQGAANWVAHEIKKGTSPEDLLKYVGNHPNVDYVPMLEYLSQIGIRKEVIMAAIEPWKGLTEGGGSLYEVGLQAHPEELLDLNKPLSEQSSQVQTTLNEIFPDLKSPDSPLRGRRIYPFGKDYVPDDGSGLEVEYPVREDLFSNPESTLYTAATDLLSSRGVPGAQYTGRSSGARDYTIWDPRRLNIIKKLMAAIGAVGAGDEVRRRSSSNGT